MRFGIGYDIHRLVPVELEGSVMLGGVAVPCKFKTIAHSDGDVILHSITDALLGSLALGDIGQWFSDKDPVNQGRNSHDFLQGAMQEVKRLGWRVEQLDLNLFAEEPKIAPVSDSIRQNLCRALGLEMTAVSLKAKTMEGLGPIGEKKAVACQALVVIRSVKH